MQTEADERARKQEVEQARELKALQDKHVLELSTVKARIGDKQIAAVQQVGAEQEAKLLKSVKEIGEQQERMQAMHQRELAQLGTVQETKLRAARAEVLAEARAESIAAVQHSEQKFELKARSFVEEAVRSAALKRSAGYGASPAPGKRDGKTPSTVTAAVVPVLPQTGPPAAVPSAPSRSTATTRSRKQRVRASLRPTATHFEPTLMRCVDCKGMFYCLGKSSSPVRVRARWKSIWGS
jgi:hypothetical protein